MSDPQQAAALVAAKRAEVMAKLAKFQQSSGMSPSSSRSPGNSQQQHRPSQPRMSASQWKPPPTPPKASPSPVPVLPPTGGLNASGKIDLVEIQRKIAEAKARVTASGASLPRSPVASMRTADKIPAAPPQIALDEAGNLDLKAMLDKGIIPKRETLTSKANERKAAAAAAAAKPNKEAKTLKIEQPPEDFTDTTKNPYYDPNLHAQAAPKLRRSRPLKFVQPGKFVQQANQERAKAQLEKLKQEIAESVRKAGMEVEMDVSDKAIKKEPPPAAEWWDAPFLPNKTYDDLETAPVNPDELGALVTLYVHHPIPIKPPTDNSAATPVRSLMLTKKERKKLRRQRRQEAQKEKQDRIRLGLLPPDPPKVKISNLMRVLGQEAIQDPTKIEAKVRKEMEMRQKQHELANAQRQLTPEERRAKIMNKLKEDQKTSNEVAVFKVINCSHPKHRYKIEVNAQQYQLTGMVIVHPKCHLVIVEGGPKSIKAYKKLMLRRIDWNDMPPPKDGSSDAMEIDHPEGEQQENRCFLVWEGQVKQKAFKKFTWRTFESEKMAREELSKWHVEQYWDAAVLVSNEELAARQPEL